MNFALAAALVILVLVGLAIAGARPRAHTVAEAGGDAVSLPPFLQAFVHAVNSCESSSDPAYVSAVAALRHEPGATAKIIADAFEQAAPDLRPALVLAAGAAEISELRPLLADVASSAPTRRGEGEDSWLVEHSKLRLMAVDGLEALAAKGDENAVADLEKLAQSSDLAVQAAAVVALTHGSNSAESLQRLRTRLAPDRRFLLNLRRLDVREAPQIGDPRHHLAVKPHSTDQRAEIGEHRDISPAARRRARTPQIASGR